MKKGKILAILLAAVALAGVCVPVVENNISVVQAKSRKKHKRQYKRRTRRTNKIHKISKKHRITTSYKNGILISNDGSNLTKGVMALNSFKLVTGSDGFTYVKAYGKFTNQTKHYVTANDWYSTNFAGGESSTIWVAKDNIAQRVRSYKQGWQARRYVDQQVLANEDVESPEIVFTTIRNSKNYVALNDLDNTLMINSKRKIKPNKSIKFMLIFKADSKMPSNSKIISFAVSRGGIVIGKPFIK